MANADTTLAIHKYHIHVNCGIRFLSHMLQLTMPIQSHHIQPKLVRLGSTAVLQHCVLLAD